MKMEPTLLPQCAVLSNLADLLWMVVEGGGIPRMPIIRRYDGARDGSCMLVTSAPNVPQLKLYLIYDGSKWFSGSTVEWDETKVEAPVEADLIEQAQPFVDKWVAAAVSVRPIRSEVTEEAMVDAISMIRNEARVKCRCEFIGTPGADHFLDGANTLCTAAASLYTAYQKEALTRMDISLKSAGVNRLSLNVTIEPDYSPLELDDIVFKGRMTASQGRLRTYYEYLRRVRDGNLLPVTGDLPPEHLLTPEQREVKGCSEFTNMVFTDVETHFNA